MTLLGGLAPAAFLRRHWQKRPLLVRQAIPGFAGLVDRKRLFQLATRDDVVSRLVLEHPRRRSRWERHDGPFGGLDTSMLPASHWTLLVHGIESLVPGGWELLRRFSFVPAARIDDLMVSYAAPGGSVGPHDDRYDVFLLQGPGRRRWQIQRGGDRRTAPDQAMKVLGHFVPDEEWLLEPGDMLYLPPGVAHRGVAEGPCFTYSIGFLAPSHAELVQSFLGFLGESAGMHGDALYRDPDLVPARDWLTLSDAMVQRLGAVLGTIRWDAREVGTFLGRMLTHPKSHVFKAPDRPLILPAFARRLAGHGRLVLALPTRGLVRGDQLFLNGEAHGASPAALRRFTQLMAQRSLTLPLALSAAERARLHAWYLAGYLTIAARA